MKKNIILGISIVLLILSIGIFVYLKYLNNNLKKEITNLQEKNTIANDVIEKNQDQKKDKENEYEKLKEELKEKVEEYDVWIKLEEKLNTALS